MEFIEFLHQFPTQKNVLLISTKCLHQFLAQKSSYTFIFVLFDRNSCQLKTDSSGGFPFKAPRAFGEYCTENPRSNFLSWIPTTVPFMTLFRVDQFFYVTNSVMQCALCTFKIPDLLRKGPWYK